MSTHDQTPAGGTENGMDGNETLVRARMDTVMGAVTPDTVSLVGGGFAKGRGIRRRRRLVGAGGLAVSATVLGALTVTGAAENLFDSSAGPADRTLTQLEPATPRGLAAAVLSHTSGLGTLIGVGGMDTGMGPDQIVAEVAYRTASGVKVDLQVFGGPMTDSWARSGPCADGSAPDYTCTEQTLPDGTLQGILEPRAGGRSGDRADTGPGYQLRGVISIRDDSVVAVIETVVGSGSLPLQVEDLQAIAADPAVGMFTTEAFNAAGQDIPDFSNDLSTSSGSSSGSSEAGGGASPSASASTSAPAAPPDGSGTTRSGGHDRSESGSATHP
jgi:hypothetical protein